MRGLTQVWGMQPAWGVQGVLLGRRGGFVTAQRKGKGGWAWWQARVIPATREAKAENCLSLGDGGCSEPRLHKGTPAWVTEQDSVLEKKKEKTFWARHGGTRL